MDDSPFLVKQIRKFLEAEGHEVVAEGQDGIEGVNLYLEHRPDLILLDITMPNKDGRQCLEEVLQADDRARAVIVSAVKDRKMIMSCLNLGARGFIEKPLKFSDEAFCNEFRRVILEAIEK
ncbi:MAG: response regulator [Myxococcales bacterium]|nr:response regulator [Myxococcales bacterium]